MTKLRVGVFSVILLLPFLALEGRLFWMQVLNAEEYRSRGDWTRTWVEVVPTVRGRIFDRNGELLAGDERCFDVDIVLADFEIPRAKGKDPELDYGKMARVLKDVLGRIGAGKDMDVRRCAEMLAKRELPVKSVMGEDGRSQVVTDFDGICAMLGTRAIDGRAEPAVVYRNAVRALKAADKSAFVRCHPPGRVVSARDRRNIVKQEWRQPQRLWQGMSYEQVSEIAIDEAQFPGLEIRARTRRVYPQGRLLCQGIGAPGQMDEAEYGWLESGGVFRREMGLELTDEDRANRAAAEAEAKKQGRSIRWLDRHNPALDGKLAREEYDRLEFRGAFFGDSVGRSGIESRYEDVLSGERGLERRSKNLLTKRETVIERIAPVPGKDVYLTIDLALQRKAEELLDDLLPQGLRGSIVVLDPNTGEVLALASAPGFDANWLVPGVAGKDEWAVMADKEAAVMLNRAIGSQLPFGSVWKSITAAAALEAGKITPQDKFECRGYFYPEKHKFGCWIAAHGGMHGPVNLREGLAQSCNCFFFETGSRVGIDAIDEMANRFGAGRKTGIDLPGEAAGLVPGPAWKRASGRGRWGLADTLNVSIGQGDLLGSPLQAARFMAGFATGRLPVPRINKSLEPQFEDLHLKPETLAAVRAGLEAVTMDPIGTAHGKPDNVIGLNLFKAAGKTSTAQSSSRDRGLAHHGWFAGYAPFDKPQVAFCVMIEHGGAGSGIPAKTAARLLHAIWPEVDLPGDTAPLRPTTSYDPALSAPADDSTEDGPPLPEDLVPETPR